MKTRAIIPAAGQGKRFGQAKQFVNLAGEPLLFHALKEFEKTPSVLSVTLVTLEADVPTLRQLIQKSSFKKITQIISGGKERQDSVKKGFDILEPCDLVLVHDGVRPFVTAKMIENVILEAAKTGACIIGLPVKETTKKVNQHQMVEATIDRSTLWSIQTPQVFRYDLLKEAFTKAGHEKFLGTDEAMLVERLGAPVKVIEGSAENIKITTPEDLTLAELILKQRKMKS